MVVKETGQIEEASKLHKEIADIKTWIDSEEEKLKDDDMEELFPRNDFVSRPLTV